MTGVKIVLYGASCVIGGAGLAVLVVAVGVDRVLKGPR